LFGISDFVLGISVVQARITYLQMMFKPGMWVEFRGDPKGSRYMFRGCLYCAGGRRWNALGIFRLAGVLFGGRLAVPGGTWGGSDSLVAGLVGKGHHRAAISCLCLLVWDWGLLIARLQC